jgi:hypothetical protein
MLVPLNTSKRNDLCLSICKTQNGYSVKVVSVKNGYGLDDLPSYCFDIHTEYTDAVIWMEDYPAIEDKDLYKCIEKCMKQIENLL